MADFYEQLGMRIGGFRRERNLSQERLAERAELAASYVSHIEAGSKRPTLDVLLRLADALDVPIWRFVADERLAPDERAWESATRNLADAVRGLPATDVELLTALARRLGPARPSSSPVGWRTTRKRRARTR